MDDRALRLEAMPHGADREKVAEILGISAEEILDFSSNINPWGWNAALEGAAREALSEIAFYPEPKGRPLVEALADHEGLPREAVHAGNGGAELILRAALAMRLLPDFEERHSVLLVVPGFSEYEEAFRTAGFDCRHHVLKEERGFVLDESILDEINPSLRAVVLTSPNNPTGIPVEPELLSKLRAVCRENGVYLFIDECFLEFLPPERQALLRQRGEAGEKLLTLHSFTKFYAMPGLRAGALYCHDEKLGALLSALCPAWPLSGPAEAAALEALRLPSEETGRWREKIASAREELREGLLALGFEGVTGEANYLFFKGPEDLQLRLLLPPGRPLLLRSCAEYPGLGRGFYRAAVKRPEENRLLLSRLEEL